MNGTTMLYDCLEECPACGYDNPADYEECTFCGAGL